jgi:hypothetical protein
VTGWLSDKVSRVKLGGRSPSGFGIFEALEFLQLGIHGKWALWQALAVVAATDERLRGADFLRLATRAATQESQVEQQRLHAARLVFEPAAQLILPEIVLSFGTIRRANWIEERYCLKATRSVTSKVRSSAPIILRVA